VKARNIGLFLASRPGEKVKNVADNKFGMREDTALLLAPYQSLLSLLYSFFPLVNFLISSFTFFVTKLWIFSRECNNSWTFTTFSYYILNGDGFASNFSITNLPMLLLKREISGSFLFMYIMYSALLCLPTHRFHCVGGWWDRTLALTARHSNHSARSHPIIC
jgi:hypothetical protein